MMFIVFMGPPGAGKGTQSKLLIERLQVPHLSTGDMLRQACSERTKVGREAQRYMDAGQLVPDPAMVKIVESMLSQPDCAGGALLDGFPRTIVQAEALDKFLNGRRTPLDAVLELKIDDGKLVERLAGRARTDGRSDDKPEVIRQRLQGFYERAQDLLAYYAKRGLLHKIDGVGTPEQVFARIETTLERCRRPAQQAGGGRSRA